jgi:hypothetical protein
MRDSDIYLHTKLCWSKGVYVNVVPTGKTGIFKIEITKNKVVEVGKLEFDDKPKKGDLSIWQKQAELYKQFYNKLK